MPLVRRRSVSGIAATLRMMLFAAPAPSFDAAREEQFAEILSRFGGIISGICFSYGTGREDREDLRQDILTNLWRGLACFRGDSSLKTWVYRVALNTCVSTVRRRSRRVSTVPLDSFDFPDGADDGITAERVDTLHRLISDLTPLDKAVVTMWLDEQPYEEISLVTGLSRNNVAVRLNRIKEKLARKTTKSEAL